jgi:ribosome-associated protein
MEERERVEVAIAAARQTKAEEMLLFDMDNRSSITDFVLLCSGRSQAHVRGICERIEEAMRKAGYRCTTMEGLQEGSWVLMDYDVLLVHVFHPDTRAYYDLEGLLQDYPSERIAGDEPGPAPDDDRADSAA